MGDHKKGVAIYKIDQFGCLAGLEPLQGALRINFRGTDNGYTSLFREECKKAAILNMAKSLEADDQPPSVIQKNEKAYFSCVGPERHALSMKLTLASVLSRGFVADRHLWQWIENVTRASKGFPSV